MALGAGPAAGAQARGTGAGGRAGGRAGSKDRRAGHAGWARGLCAPGRAAGLCTLCTQPVFDSV